MAAQQPFVCEYDTSTTNRSTGIRGGWTTSMCTSYDLYSRVADPIRRDGKFRSTSRSGTEKH